MDSLYKLVMHWSNIKSLFPVERMALTASSISAIFVDPQPNNIGFPLDATYLQNSRFEISPEPNFKQGQSISIRRSTASLS